MPKTISKKIPCIMIFISMFTFTNYVVFAGFSFADRFDERRMKYMPPPWIQMRNSLKKGLIFIIENSPDWIQGYTIPRTVSDIEANREKRKQIIKDIRDNMIIVY